MTKRERRDNLKQLRAESQRLLRETRDASFKPVPLVQKPISSVLEKIRQRKLEIAKKSVAINSMSLLDDDDDGDDGFVREVVVDCNSGGPIDEDRGNDGVVKVASEETIELPANMKSNLDELCMDESSDIKDHSSCESIPSQMDVDKESKQEFRAPIGDTQELFSDSQTSDSMDELPSKTPSSPLEEVMAPSILAMNLKLDSAPPDDVSSDEESNDKENIAPHPHGLTDLSSFLDPVKAFVDDEAEEEDDSDNDMLRFQDNEEDEDNEDLEELKDMIATGYEEKPVDNEKRNQLHQKWLEQQDAAGTENLLQKFNCGSKLKETTLLEEEEDEEGDEYKEDFGGEAAEDSNPTNVARMNLKKAKQMIPQMFTDKDDVYLSSDDEETEKRLAKQCLFEKSEPAMFLSPAEDESSREVFGLIKKLNIVPDSKKKAKTPSLYKMPPVGGKSNILSKSSFLGRGSNHSLPSSQKKASGKVRSFIFGRDDSNSRSSISMSGLDDSNSRCSISMSEGSSDAIQRENQPKRPASAKFSNSQTKASTQNTRSVAEMKSGTSLFEILRRSSLQSEQCTRDSVVVQTESVFAAFKLSKKPIKTEGKA
nr:mitotic apparatus protein p62-like [Quercus suber]